MKIFVSEEELRECWEYGDKDVLSNRVLRSWPAAFISDNKHDYFSHWVEDTLCSDDDPLENPWDFEAEKIFINHLREESGLSC